jgi:putative addiction module component (TIGR02574 family)
MITIELEKMDVSEKIGIIGMIWNSLDTENVPLYDWEKKELSRRMELHKKDPNRGRPWEGLKKELLSR